jgi:hypothetical protein
MGWLNVLGVPVDDDRVLRDLLNGPGSKWPRAATQVCKNMGRSVRSVGHKNGVEAIIEQSVLMDSSATPLFYPSAGRSAFQRISVARTTSIEKRKTHGPAHIHAF